MRRRILQFWWLILAWLLAMFGENFWHINIGELFASLAIILGVIWTYIRWRREKNRKLRLIEFPDKWMAYKRQAQSILEVQIFADVFIPHHSASAKGFAEIEGEIIHLQFVLNSGRNGRWVLVGTTPLSPISQQAKSITVSMEIELDGGLIKSSGKRTISIIDS